MSQADTPDVLTLLQVRPFVLRSEREIEMKA